MERFRTSRIAAFALFLLTGCSQAAEKSLPSASPRPPAKNVEVSKEATPGISFKPYASGGLGVSRAQWVKEHGEPLNGLDGKVAVGKYTVTFIEGACSILHYEWGEDDPAPMSVARLHAKSLMPKDAKFVRKYLQDTSHDPVEVFNSPSLTPRFHGVTWGGESHSPWGEGKPGDFSVIYGKLESGKVAGVDLSVGDNR